MMIDHDLDQTDLARHFGQGFNPTSDTAGGIISPPLSGILKIYAQAFERLQKVARALTRLEKQIEKLESELALARRWS